MEVLITHARTLRHMLKHIKTLGMDEEEAKADYARHNEEVLAHVRANKVETKRNCKAPLILDGVLCQ